MKTYLPGNRHIHTIFAICHLTNFSMSDGRARWQTRKFPAKIEKVNEWLIENSIELESVVNDVRVASVCRHYWHNRISNHLRDFYCSPYYFDELTLIDNLSIWVKFGRINNNSSNRRQKFGIVSSLKSTWNGENRAFIECYCCCASIRYWKVCQSFRLKQNNNVHGRIMV